MLTPTKQSTMFEIRVAVIGYVSVGKTTLINALFGGEYGQVAMKRTTAVVNSFCISTAQDSMSLEERESEDDSIVEVVSKKLSASAVLKESVKDNKSFRTSDVVKERSFDIELDEPLHKMRPDTKLTIVDIPGINEAGTSSKYRDYVNENWHTFDIVVLVMDARQGVNTDEQHNLLNLAKENIANRKSLPLVVLSNKVDDPDDEEQMALLDEARTAIEKLFHVSSRKAALDAILDDAKSKSAKGTIRPRLFPVVLPISAMHAFVYRCGARLSFEEFCKMDSDFIEKIGKDSYGRQWKRFGTKQQLQKAYEAVSEDEQRQDGLEASNFDTFTKVLSICIGNEDNQTTLIQKQVDMALSRMKEAKSDSDLASELLSAHRKLVMLSKPTKNLPASFWGGYKTLKQKAIDEFNKEFKVKRFASPINQLFKYMNALMQLKLDGEMDRVVKEVKELVLQYAIAVIEANQFKAKSVCDQSLILGSMLLASNETFNTHFGFLKLHLEAKHTLAQTSPIKCSNRCEFCNVATTLGTYGVGTEFCASCRRTYIESDVSNCPNCSRSYVYSYEPRVLSRKKNGDGTEIGQCSSPACKLTFTYRKGRPADFKMKVADGKLVPVNLAQYNQHVTVTVADSLKDETHFGYVLWKGCQLLKKADALIELD